MAATSKTGQNVRGALLTACGLLGIGGAQAQATEIKGAVLGYTEPDRVSAIETVVDVAHTFAGGQGLNFKLVYDGLTGASANGAVPWTDYQTFTRPSGAGSYQADPEQTPLDDTFRDSRVALSGGASLPWGRLSTVSAGLYGSGEHDYMSLGANLALSRDFNKRNTTVALRGAMFHDTINPEGGRPTPFGIMTPAGSELARLDGDGTKDIMDLGLSLTQTINRSTIAHLSYTFSQVDGYQTDPYKLLSVVNPETGAPGHYVFEKRPDSRAKHVLLAKLNHHLSRDIVRLSYRFMTDDWGVNSHTIDLEYRLKMGEHRYLEPSVRWYTQSEADFYRRFLLESEALPLDASADYRLGDMQTWAWGLKHGRRLGNGHDLTVRGVYYRQSGESHPAEAVGALRDLDLFPTVEAFIFQVGYSFGT